MTYATISDVSTRLGRPITDPAEIEQVGAWLDDVETIIFATIPPLTEDTAPTVATLRMVEANAVVRKIRNPEGYSSETVDDYTYRFNEAARRGDLFLTDDEWALLSPRTPGAFSTRPYFEPDSDTATGGVL